MAGELTTVKSTAEEAVEEAVEAAEEVEEEAEGVDEEVGLEMMALAWTCSAVWMAEGEEVGEV